MEASAYGIGLLPNEFWDLTFHEFFLMQRGRNEVVEMKERFEWEKKDLKIDLEKRKKRAEYARKKYELLNKNKNG